MRITSIAVSLVLGVVASSAAVAQPAKPRAPSPAPIRTFDVATLEGFGREIYEQDVAAWVATDAMRAMPGFNAERLVGWVVVRRDDGRLVRFLKADGDELVPGYDIEVDAARRAKVSATNLAPVTDSEVAMFTARQTAIQKVSKRCRAGYNTATIADPEKPGWIVWLLAPMPSAQAYAIGGHFRVSVTADGREATAVDELSNSCFVMDNANVPKGAKPAMAVVTHMVSPTPVETHVFAQLQMKQPLVVVVSEKMAWIVENGRMSEFKLK